METVQHDRVADLRLVGERDELVPPEPALGYLMKDELAEPVPVPAAAPEAIATSETETEAKPEERAGAAKGSRPDQSIAH